MSRSLSSIPVVGLKAAGRGYFFGNGVLVKAVGCSFVVISEGFR